MNTSIIYPGTQSAHAWFALDMRLTSSPALTFHMQTIVATLGVSLRYGMWGTDGQEVGCTAMACLLWLGLGGLFSTAFLRVYRNHDVLVKHSGVMWPIVSQVSDRKGLLRRAATPLVERRAEPCAVFEIAARFNVSERAMVAARACLLLYLFRQLSAAIAQQW